MNTSEEYNKHLQDFYASCFREYAMKHGIGNKVEGSELSSAQQYADEMLESYGAAINKSMAYELLNKIEITSSNNESKLIKYPSMFWQTKDGKDELRSVASKEAKNGLQKLFDKDELTAIDIILIWKQIVVCAKKIALKDSKIGSDMVIDFSEGFIKLFQIKNEENNTNEKNYLSAFKNSLNEITSIDNDFKVHAYYGIDNHLHELKNAVERNVNIISPVKEEKEKMKM